VRYRFDERIQEEFGRAKASRSPLSLLMLDIDLFKQVNDRWGHLGGDKVLHEVSQAILSQTRETDFCARYGGEEIAVLMPLTATDNALAIAERIRRKVESEPIGPDGIRVTISGGIAAVTDDMAEPDDLVAAADQALYAAKNQGRNRVVTVP
jgi:diguanylate cyclase (GGDEF)-like protein